VTEKPSQTSLSVIATRLPYIDDRSLSQAWRSALHVASDGPAAAMRSERRGTAPSGRAERATTLKSASAATGDVRARASHVATVARAAAAGAELATRRVFDARTAAAARSAFARARSYPPFRSALTLDVANERVHLLLRRDGSTLHVVAVCRPEVAETVRRALVAADAHLRLRGETVRSSVEIAREVRA